MLNLDDIKFQIIITLLGLLPEAILESTLLPLFPYLVRHLLPKETNVGYFTGLLGSSFYLPLLIMNLVWGAASDRIGRKPVLMMGMIICLISTIALGLSKSYALALAARFLAGLFGANSTVAKGMIGDIAKDQRNRAWGYAMYGSVYGLSGILGPFIGGLLANPVTIYPKWFAAGGFFDKYPYILVCALSGFLSVIAIPVSSKYLKLKHEYQPLMDEDIGDLELEELQIVTRISTGEGETLRQRIVANQNQDLLPNPTDNTSNYRFNIMTWNTMGPIILYMLIAYTNMNYNIALPLYFAAPIKQGGIELSSQNTAFKFTILAGTKLFVQIFLFDIALSRIGNAKKVYNLGMMCYIPAHILIPILVHLSPSGRDIVSSLIMMCFGFCESFGYLSVIMMITESQSTKNLGLAHGLASTCSAFVRAICPNISGSLWEWGVYLQWPWLVFFTGGIVALMGVIASS